MDLRVIRGIKDRKVTLVQGESAVMQGLPEHRGFLAPLGPRDQGEPQVRTELQEPREHLEHLER